MSGASPDRKRKRGERRDNKAAAALEPAADALHAVVARLHADFQCAICHGLVVAPHILPCSHRFCGACIMEWTKRKKTCPECRTVVRGRLALERGVVRRQRWFIAAQSPIPNVYAFAPRTS